MSALEGQIQHSPADIIRQLMVNLNYGNSINPDGTIAGDGTWPITADTELNLPDNDIIVTNTEGELHGRIMITGAMPEHFGFQVKVRANDPNIGWTKINNLVTALDQNMSYNSVTMLYDGSNKSYNVGAVTRKGCVNALGRETSATRRFLYTINAVVVIWQTN